MKRLLLAVAAAAALGSAARAEDPSVVAVLTSAEPQARFMAMVLTLHAVKAGAPARILLCGPGGDLALRDPPPEVAAPLKPSNLSARAVMLDAMKAGTTVQVCAVYLPQAGLGPEALLDGVTVATPPAMAEAMLVPGARVWSF
jgi:hypothetical protein